MVNPYVCKEMHALARKFLEQSVVRPAAHVLEAILLLPSVSFEHLWLGTLGELGNGYPRCKGSVGHVVHAASPHHLAGVKVLEASVQRQLVPQRVVGKTIKLPPAEKPDASALALPEQLHVYAKVAGEPITVSTLRTLVHNLDPFVDVFPAFSDVRHELLRC